MTRAEAETLQLFSTKEWRLVPQRFALFCISRCDRNLKNLWVYVSSNAWAVVRSVTAAFLNLISLLIWFTAAGSASKIKDYFDAKLLKDARLASNRDEVHWLSIESCPKIVSWPSIRIERWKLWLSPEMTLEKERKNWHKTLFQPKRKPAAV